MICFSNLKRSMQFCWFPSAYRELREWCNNARNIKKPKLQDIINLTVKNNTETHSFHERKPIQVLMAAAGAFELLQNVLIRFLGFISDHHERVVMGVAFLDVLFQSQNLFVDDFVNFVKQYTLSRWRRRYSASFGDLAGSINRRCGASMRKLFGYLWYFIFGKLQLLYALKDLVNFCQALMEGVPPEVCTESAFLQKYALSLSAFLQKYALSLRQLKNFLNFLDSWHTCLLQDRNIYYLLNQLN